MYKYKSKYHLGQRVVVGDGQIEATIEEILFRRSFKRPMYRVFWWMNGGYVEKEIHEEDVDGVFVPKERL